MRNASYFLDLDYLECMYFSILVQIMGMLEKQIPYIYQSLVHTLELMKQTFWQKTKLHNRLLDTLYPLSGSQSFGWHWNKPPERGTMFCFCKLCSCWAALQILVAATVGKPARHCSISNFYHSQKNHIYSHGWVGGVYIPLPYAQL